MFKPKTLPARQPHKALNNRPGLYYKGNRPVKGEEQPSRRQPVADGQVSDKKALQLLNRLARICVVIALLVLVVYELSLSNSPKVIIVKGATQTKTNTFLQPSKVYEQAANKLLRKSFTSRFKLTINKSAIDSAIGQEFPELSNATITLPLIGHQPSLNIEPAVGVMILTDANSDAFAIDSNGRVIKQLSLSAVPTTKLPVVSDPGNQTAQLGKIALPQSNVKLVSLIAGQLKAANLVIQSMVIPLSSNELDVRLAATSYYVKFNLNDSANYKQQIGSFFATQHYLTGKGVTPSAYIDVRVPGRAYYK